VGLQTCGRLSEGSSRATNFYELEAQVKGASSLEESLVGALSIAVGCLRASHFTYLLGLHTANSWRFPSDRSRAMTM
jgi:hypothetical protein